MPTSWRQKDILRLMLAIVLLAALAPAAAQAESIPYPNNSDDNISGAVPLDAIDEVGAATYNDWLSDVVMNGSDTRDVYAVWLHAGESITASLPLVGDGFGLKAFDPRSEDVTTDLPVASSEAEDPSISFTADDTGYHYLEVYSTGWSSAYYELTVTVTRADTDVQISSLGRTLNLWAYPTVSGAVLDRFGRVPTGNLVLAFSFDGRDWMPLARQNYTGGTFTFLGLDQWRKTYYMVTFEATPTHSTNSEVTQAFATKSRVSNPVAPATMYAGKAQGVYGYIEPQHTAGSWPVRIYRYKKVSGSWKSFGYVKAKAYNVNGDKSKYYASLSFPSTGSWKLRAYAPADSQHASAWCTGQDYVSVK